MNKTANIIDKKQEKVIITNPDIQLFKINDKSFNNLLLEINQIRNYLIKLKTDCTNFDKTNNSTVEQNYYLTKIKDEAFKLLNEHFNSTSRIFDNMEKADYIKYQDLYITHMYDVLYPNLIPKHIYDKPFGYPGDFVLMNYIFDYQKTYIGNSTYEKLINYYSVTLPFCISNVERKDFLKNMIIATSKNNTNAKITSVACGSIRELLELKDQKLKISEFNCIDFESKVFDYIKSKIENSYLSEQTQMNFFNQNIFDIIKKGDYEGLAPQDLIYFSGIFDYLPKRVAKKIVNIFYEKLNDNGKLIICNCSKQKKALHSYYEVLGKWIMIYRTEEEMIELIEGIPTVKYRFEYTSPNNCYHYLVLSK